MSIDPNVFGYGLQRSDFELLISKIDSLEKDYRIADDFGAFDRNISDIEKKISEIAKRMPQFRDEFDKMFYLIQRIKRPIFSFDEDEMDEEQATKTKALKFAVESFKNFFPQPPEHLVPNVLSEDLLPEVASLNSASDWVHLSMINKQFNEVLKKSLIEFLAKDSLVNLGINDSLFNMLLKKLEKGESLRSLNLDYFSISKATIDLLSQHCKNIKKLNACACELERRWENSDPFPFKVLFENIDSLETLNLYGHSECVHRLDLLLPYLIKYKDSLKILNISGLRAPDRFRYEDIFDNCLKLERILLPYPSNEALSANRMLPLYKNLSDLRQINLLSWTTVQPEILLQPETLYQFIQQHIKLVDLTVNLTPEAFLFIAKNYKDLQELKSRSSDSLESGTLALLVKNNENLKVLMAANPCTKEELVEIAENGKNLEWVSLATKCSEDEVDVLKQLFLLKCPCLTELILHPNKTPSKYTSL